MSNGMEQPDVSVTWVDMAPFLGGLALFGWWLLTTSLGRKALADSKPRRNVMAPFVPFIPFFTWLMGTLLLQPVAYQAVNRFIGTMKDWQTLFLDNLVFSGVAMVTVILILAIVRFTFARGLRGFGLRLRTIPRDFALAFANLLAVWPLVIGATTLTIALAQALSRAFWDKSFEMPRHEGLKIISEYPEVPLQVLIIILAVVVAPLVEEMLFRGLFQTMFRSYLRRPWAAIAITSVLFAITHANPEHWLTLFVLAMGLGYAYEKSGSLLRPIFMHAMFNGFTIAAALTEAQPAWLRPGSAGDFLRFFL